MSDYASKESDEDLPLFSRNCGKSVISQKPQPKTSSELARQAEKARDAGMQVSRETSGEAWHAYALGFLMDYLIRHETMHVDDLWASGLARPESPRALGSVMKTASAREWITQIPGGYGGVTARPSVNSNMQLKPIWRSLLYRRASS